MQSDERMKSMDMPFDGKRMIFGGFMPLTDGGARQGRRACPRTRERGRRSA